MVSCSRRVANSKSESASSRRGGKSSELYGDGSAQSVHSRAMLKLPQSNSRSRRVSIPAIRRAFKTWKRWPRSGWNGWRTSAHPKCELRSGAVRADRRRHRRQRHPYRHPRCRASTPAVKSLFNSDHPIRLALFDHSNTIQSPPSSQISVPTPPQFERPLRGTRRTVQISFWNFKWESS